MMTRDPAQSRAEIRLSVYPPQSVWGELLLKQVEIRKAAGANMGGVDVDGDSLITIIDLFLVVTIWFAFSLSVLMCYLCFDTFDRMRRNRDIELGNEKHVFDEQNDYERVNNEGSETDESLASGEPGVTIDNFESAYFTNGKDLA